MGFLAGGACGGIAGYFYTSDWMLALAAGAGGALILGFWPGFLQAGSFCNVHRVCIFHDHFIFGRPSAMSHLIALVVGVFIGTLALGFERQLVIAITAFCGGIGGMGLLLSMAGIQSGAAQLLLGLALGAFERLSRLCLI